MNKHTGVTGVIKRSVRHERTSYNKEMPPKPKATDGINHDQLSSCSDEAIDSPGSRSKKLALWAFTSASCSGSARTCAGARHCFTVTVNSIRLTFCQFRFLWTEICCTYALPWQHIKVSVLM